MKYRVKTLHVIFCAAIASFAGSASAAVSADEAKQLGSTLTLWGAEKAGNKDGTIPAYEGPVKVPASYDPKKPGVRPDPYASEKPLFSISAQNMDKYADKLSDGLKAMMKRYPTFRIDIYPSHRNAAYPKPVLDYTIKNATSCRAEDQGLKLVGCYAGLPFPIPKTGNEAMWNHLLKWSAYNWETTATTSILVDSRGGVLLNGVNHFWQNSPWYDPKRTGVNADNLLYWRVRMDTSAPGRKAGEKLLIWDPVDTRNVGRRAWQYIPGQRRVKLSPDLAYDTPNPQSGGAGSMDDSQLFLGAQDRFDFKLLGKKEMFIPYNQYKFADGAACPDKVKYTKNHHNPSCNRFELHRVFVVEATLKPEFRHTYKRRMFYFDEDTAGAGLADNFDASGNIYRVSFAHSHPMYEGPYMTSDAYTNFDLQTGIYFTPGEVAESGGWFPVATPQPEVFFSSEALASEGIR